jgi:hypothetical protein
MVMLLAACSQQAVDGRVQAAKASPPALPSIPQRTPYPQARAQLTQAGFEPVRVFQRRRETRCGDQDTPCFPELLDCGITAGWLCDWLFRRRMDGALFDVETWPLCNAGTCSGPAYQRIRPIEPRELDEYVFAKVDGRPDKSLPPPPPPEPEPPGAPRLPPIRSGLNGFDSAAGVSYPRGRRMLIAQGFTPVRLIARDKAGFEKSWNVCDSYAERCRAFPEMVYCSGTGRGECAWLYRRRADGRYWLVFTELDEGRRGHDQLRCCGYRAAKPGDLEDLEALCPDGRRYRPGASHDGE